MAKTNLKKKLQFWGTGRRKKAIARVRLIPAGTGVIQINDRAFEDYFPQSVLQYVVKQPLALLGVEAKYDVIVNVYGGGYTGPSGNSKGPSSSRRGQPSGSQKGRFPDSRPSRKREKEIRLEKSSSRSSILKEIKTYGFGKFVCRTFFAVKHGYVNFWGFFKQFVDLSVFKTCKNFAFALICISA